MEKRERREKLGKHGRTTLRCFWAPKRRLFLAPRLLQPVKVTKKVRTCAVCIYGHTSACAFKKNLRVLPHLGVDLRRGFGAGVGVAAHGGKRQVLRKRQLCLDLRARTHTRPTRGAQVM